MEELLLEGIRATCFARCASDPVVVPPDGSSPPLACVDPLRPLHAASFASNHPVQSTVREEQGDDPEEEEP